MTQRWSPSHQVKSIKHTNSYCYTFWKPHLKPNCRCIYRYWERNTSQRVCIESCLMRKVKANVSPPKTTLCLSWTPIKRNRFQNVLFFWNLTLGFWFILRPRSLNGMKSNETGCRGPCTKPPLTQTHCKRNFEIHQKNQVQHLLKACSIFV